MTVYEKAWKGVQCKTQIHYSFLHLFLFLLIFHHPKSSSELIHIKAGKENLHFNASLLILY